MSTSRLFVFHVPFLSSDENPCRVLVDYLQYPHFPEAYVAARTTICSHYKEPLYKRFDMILLSYPPSHPDDYLGTEEMMPGIWI